MRPIATTIKYLFFLSMFCGLLGVAGLIGAYYYYSPQLPNVETLREVKFQTPLRIYSADNKLISEFGEKRRTPVTYDQVPAGYRDALLAAEDTRFFEHFGIDIKGLFRAAFQLASTGRIQSGGSTITMQVAKNFFLTRERTFERKFMEIMLAIRIEQELSKEEILQLYVNKIYLGHRSYGIQAAANVYYGKQIDELTLAQLAMIAGLPKAPSAYNPITNPNRAIVRRNWILQRMLQLNFIDEQQYADATQTPVTAKYHRADIELEAPYLAEMVRKELYQQYGDNLYTEGYRVYTTVHSEMQQAAEVALQNGLINYSKRHGYFGAVKELDLETLTPEEVSKELNSVPSYVNIEPALVTAIEDQSVQVQRRNGEQLTLSWDNLKWARRYITVNRVTYMPKKVEEFMKAGDVVYIRPLPVQKELTEEQLAESSEETVVSLPEIEWELTQLPKVQGSFIAENPKNGAIKAIVGGFNFHHNKFNRATQANRQLGSNVKPFIYTAALAKGYTPATLINDAPIVFHDNNLESSWRPQNYTKKFYGPTRLREALYKSRNLVSIRVLQGVTIPAAQEFLSKVGFDREKLPPNLSLSLGSADVTPMEVVNGYASIANGGYKVNPYFIQRIDDAYGETIYTAKPVTVCEDCIYIGDDAADVVSGQQVSPFPLPEQIMDPQVNFIIYNIMQDVINLGTGRRAKVLERTDLAGKTGTTNDQKDAWFSGFNRDLVATAWVGFDQPTHLGRSEFGSTAALPIWIEFMQTALADKPNSAPLPPDGIVSMRIDPKTGLRAYPGQDDAIFEVFRKGNEPRKRAPVPGVASQETSSDDIF